MASGEQAGESIDKPRIKKRKIVAFSVSILMAVGMTALFVINNEIQSEFDSLMDKLHVARIVLVLIFMWFGWEWIANGAGKRNEKLGALIKSNKYRFIGWYLLFECVILMGVWM